MLNGIASISEKLSKTWKKVYIVGGYCRAQILWIVNGSDVDLTTQATPDEIIRVLDVVSDKGKQYWSVVVKDWENKFEITTFRNDIWSIKHRRPAE